MKKGMKGFSNVYSFTLSKQIESKSYRVTTLIFALLLFLVPSVGMILSEVFESDDAPPVCGAKTVYVCDTTDGDADWNALCKIGGEFTDINFTDMKGDFEAAKTSLKKDKTGLLVSMVPTDTGASVTVLYDENSDMTQEDADALLNCIEGNFTRIAVQKASLTSGQLSVLTPAEIQLENTGTDGTEQADNSVAADDGFRGIASSVLIYLNIMVIYFMILIYGQGVANSVIMEKNSKLMDLFLVSVDPGAMIFGKTLAIFAAAVIQLSVWFISIFGGLTVGIAAARAINPETDSVFAQVFDTIGQSSGMISISGLIVGILLIFSGFLLYCSLAAIGGAMSEKPEDLSSTNMMFSMVLVISFFAVMYGGGFDSANTAVWMTWIPFTSILVTPARLLLGEIPWTTGLGALALTVLASVIIAWFAGKVYRMMSFYRGNPPKLGRVFEMLKNEK